ncbi:sulfate adenylyltransferase [Paenimyroides tangerinum]|uniref:sulfate adenylyltransferase n=1 Tax=Paenimyroides tangerinum TaxID=2488728 RepID=A0A3P3WE17_9FLAO|nr:GTP-binding protein [Paenimyroides tangerinum]RRJ93320.1 sulfate adenylyltransferase [Paenimyroides tangerinum]
MDILRFITAGNVDDGKSTLIGRLLYDSKSILIDQIEAIEKASKFKDNGVLDLALITDGLRAEREQGITIDVAYKYFSTPKRKFIIADAPGHIQYTRNMITGASNSQLIILLVDARTGITEQTKRHTFIASLLKIPKIVVAVNKLDLVNFDESIYKSIENEFKELNKKLNLNEVTFIPISALNGDNIVDASENMSWYKGPTLLDFLETVNIQENENLEASRLPIQYIIRPQTTELHDYRGYAGKITSGIFKKGDKIKIYPSEIEATISSIEVNLKEVDEAFAPQSAVIQLNKDIDISRGDLIVNLDKQPKFTNELEVQVCWMHQKALQIGSKYLIQNQTNRVKAVVKSIEYLVDINTFEKQFETSEVQLNQIAKIKLKTATPIAYDIFSELQAQGGIIFIDETSNVTVGAGILD